MRTDPAATHVVGLLLLVAMFAPGSLLAEESIRWRFKDRGSVSEKVNIEAEQAIGGCLAGQVAWDPYVSLSLSGRVIDAARFSRFRPGPFLECLHRNWREVSARSRHERRN